MSAPTAAVAVCAYTPDRWDVLGAAVDAALAQLGRGDELVLVVDHHPALLERARRRWPSVRVIANAGPPGLSGGRNTAVAATSADVVVFLDDDAVPRPGWLAALRRRFADPATTVVGGAVVARWEGGRAPRWFPPEFGWAVGCDYRGLPGDGAAIRNPIGANMAIRRTALDLAGPFSTELGRVGALPAGCEETEIGIRIARAVPDGRIVRDTGAAVDHLVPAARQRVGYLVRRCFHEGRSKAALTRSVGGAAALASERGYVLRVLAGGAARHLAAVLRGDLAGPARAALVVTGLAVTAAGYVGGLTR